MSNPTDTNQDSEDELYKRINNALPAYFDKRAVDAVVEIIRTEKLKLLAEVREQVVGEDERIDIQSDYDKLDVPHLETDRYPGLDGVRQASRNLCRKRQRAEIDKLEAEL